MLDNLLSSIGRVLANAPKPPAYDLGAKLGLTVSHRHMMNDLDNNVETPTESEE